MLVEIPAIFHNGSKPNYHLIRKELAKKAKEDFTCLRENTEKYKNTKYN